MHPGSRAYPTVNFGVNRSGKPRPIKSEHVEHSGRNRIERNEDS